MIKLIRTVFIITLFLVGVYPTIAQSTDSTRIIIAEGFIERMDDLIAVKVRLNNDFQTFRQDVGPTYSVNLYPNIQTNLSIGVDYRFFTASISFAPKFFPGNDDNDIRGSTKTFSLGFGATFKHWAVGINYAQVKGYYLQNTPELNPSWQEGDPYFLLPKHQTRLLNAEFGYNFNPKLSFRSLTSFTERQLKSVGSFIPAAKFEFFQMEPNVRPNDVRPDGSIVNSAQVSDNYELVIGPGYYYNFVYREKWYALIGGHAGIGAVYTNFRTYVEDDVFYNSNAEFAFRFQGRVAMGYNSRHFFTGIYLDVSDTQYEPIESDIIQEFHWYYQFVIGYRFGSPKWLKKQMTKLDEKMKR